MLVDLSHATFIDSTTLGVLMGAVKRLRPAGGELAIACNDPNIRKIFEITLLDRIFEIYPTPDEARIAPPVAASGPRSAADSQSSELAVALERRTTTIREPRPSLSICTLVGERADDHQAHALALADRAGPRPGRRGSKPSPSSSTSTSSAAVPTR